MQSSTSLHSSLSAPPYEQPPPSYDTHKTCLHNEGSTAAPSYNCTISRIAKVLIKHELETPNKQANHRQWVEAEAEIRGTMLLLRPRSQGRPSFRRIRSHFNLKNEDGSDARVQRYTLQGGQAGIAADYGKRQNVVRVRAEASQFLLAMTSLTDTLEWVSDLNAAIAISLPIEIRTMPQYRTMPRRGALSPALQSMATSCDTLPKGYVRRLSEKQIIWPMGSSLDSRRTYFSERQMNAVVDSFVACLGTSASADTEKSGVRVEPTSTCSISPSCTFTSDMETYWADFQRACLDAVEAQEACRCACVLRFYTPRTHTWFEKGGKKHIVSVGLERARLEGSEEDEGLT